MGRLTRVEKLRKGDFILHVKSYYNKIIKHFNYVILL